MTHFVLVLFRFSIINKDSNVDVDVDISGTKIWMHCIEQQNPFRGSWRPLKRRINPSMGGAHGKQACAVQSLPPWAMQKPWESTFLLRKSCHFPVARRGLCKTSIYMPYVTFVSIAVIFGTWLSGMSSECANVLPLHPCSSIDKSPLTLVRLV